MIGWNLKGYSSKILNKNKMIDVGNLQVNFSLSTLLLDKNINIEAVTLENGSVNFIKILAGDSNSRSEHQSIY